jgi:Fur family transcriptional regulator, ferric uptake regulator
MHKSHLHKNSEFILESLKKHNLKATGPRKAILKVLIGEHGPFTAEEIHHRITKKICDLATVYRCVINMEKVGLLRKCDFGDGTARYEMVEDGHHHHHVICTSCKKVEPLADCNLENINRFAQKKGFSNVTHSLEFFGLCKDCA